MSIRDAALVGARLTALFLVVDGLQNAIFYLDRGDFPPVTYWWFYVGSVTPLIAGIVLWLAARRFASAVELEAFMLDHPDEAAFDDDEEPDAGDDEAAAGGSEGLERRLILVGVVLIGMWVLAWGIPALVFEVGGLTSTPSGPDPERSRAWRAVLGGATRVAIGATLVLKREEIARTLSPVSAPDTPADV